MSYLANLMLRLAAGAAGLPEETRRRHATYLAATQGDDGGFAGRQGPSDCYYTSFALRALALLDALDERIAARAGEFLASGLAGELPGIEFFSLVLGAVVLEAAGHGDVFAGSGRDRALAVAAAVERFRRDDGGYAKNAASGAGSTYHTLLAVACRQLVGLPPTGQNEIIALVRSRRRDDGGFVEIPQMRQSGTNPTAAAVGLLTTFDALDEPTRLAAARFLTGMQTAEGGFRANTRIPAADLLSTFTGLVALADLDALKAVDLPAAGRYAQSLQQPGGGFRGGIWDDAADVEYTFYGLGVLAVSGKS